MMDCSDYSNIFDYRIICHHLMEVIFRGSGFEAVNIRNLLESNGIEVFVEDELMSYIEPWAVIPIILRVRDSDLEKANELLEVLRT